MAMLPIEIILHEILPKVHAKSLIKFKLVCKSFNTELSSHEFAYRQLRHSISTNTSRLVLLNTNDRGIHGFDIDSLESPPFIIPSYSKLGKLEYLGSCNGLFCTVDSFRELIIVNPLTGASFKAAPGNIEVQEKHPVHWYGYGFGFDSLNNDYKYVRISNTYNTNDGIYSLRTNTWRVLDKRLANRFRFRILNQDVSGALIGSCLLHWLFSNPVQISGLSSLVWIHRIGCFDVTTERWSNDVPLPPIGYDWLYDKEDLSGTSFELTYKNTITLGVLERCLCLLWPLNGTTINPSEIWIMKEYGVKESWMKLLSISDLGVNNTLLKIPFGYRKHGSSHGADEILVARSGSQNMHENEIVWYNVKNKKSRLSEIYKIDVSYSFYKTFTCIGSLVPVAGGI